MSDNDAREDLKAAMAEIEGPADKEPAPEPAEKEAAEPAGEQTEAKEPAKDKPAPGADDDDDWIPSHLAAEEKAKWRGLPPELRAVLIDARSGLDKAYGPKLQEAASLRQLKSGLDEAFQPLRAQMQQAGVSEVDVVKRYVAAEQTLMSSPEQGFAWLAQSYATRLPPERRQQVARAFCDALGVSMAPAQGAAPQNGTGATDYLDPVAGQQIAQLKQQLGQVTGFMRQQGELAQAQQRMQMQRLVDGFASAQAKDGSPAHPFFKEVEREIQAILAGGMFRDLAPPERLKAAYDKAVRLNDEVWSRIEQEKEMARARAAAEKRRAEVAKAKPASLNGRGTGGGAKPDESDDLRTILTEEIARSGMAA